MQIRLLLLHIFSPQMVSEPYFGVLFGCKMWTFWHRMAAILCFASQLRSANSDLTVKPGSANQIWINIPLLQNLFLASNFRSSVKLENEEVSIQAAMLTTYRGETGRDSHRLNQRTEKLRLQHKQRDCDFYWGLQIYKVKRCLLLVLSVSTIDCKLHLYINSVTRSVQENPWIRWDK